MTNKWKMVNDKWKVQRGFTLIELLVVIAIIGILAAIALVSFRTSQMRSRDAARKSDLKQISSALELYYSDYEKYPDASALVWGSEFTDGKTTYFKVLPKDPSGSSYYYRVVPNSNNQKYQLFAYLENSQDINIMPGVVAKNYSCGSNICNFSITSSNTTPTE